MVISVDPTCLLWRASSELYNPFLPPQLPQIYTFIPTTYFTDIMLVLFYLDMLHTLGMHASSEQFLGKLNYVERGLSRLFGEYQETPNMRFYDVTS